MTRQPGPRHWILLGSLSLAWGFAFLLIAVALASFQPLTLVAARLLLGAAALYGIMRWQGQRLPASGRWWLLFTALSITGNLIPFTLITWAEVHIASGQAGLLMALVPLSTLVLAHFFIAREQITGRRLAGVALGFCGVAVLVGADALRGLGGPALVAQLAVVAATFSYAVNNIFAKRLPPLNGLVIATGTLLAGGIIMLPAALWLEQPWQLPVTRNAWLAAAALGLFSTGLATWMYFIVVSEVGPNFVSLINYLIPLLSFGAGALLLGEPVHSWQFAGLIAVCGGIALCQPQRRP
jgi:drug/metabolite transporter (DMT)-like permease